MNLHNQSLRQIEQLEIKYLSLEKQYKIMKSYKKDIIYKKNEKGVQTELKGAMHLKLNFKGFCSAEH